jgi:hypothetical protein
MTSAAKILFLDAPDVVGDVFSKAFSAGVRWFIVFSETQQE